MRDCPVAGCRRVADCSPGTSVFGGVLGADIKRRILGLAMLAFLRARSVTACAILPHGTRTPYPGRCARPLPPARRQACTVLRFLLDSVRPLLCALSPQHSRLPQVATLASHYSLPRAMVCAGRDCQIFNPVTIPFFRASDRPGLSFTVPEPTDRRFRSVRLLTLLC